MSLESVVAGPHCRSGRPACCSGGEGWRLRGGNAIHVAHTVKCCSRVRFSHGRRTQGSPAFRSKATERALLDKNAMESLHVSSSADSASPIASSEICKSTNIVWQECSVNKEERQKLLQQKSCVIWITGLSGSGKSTLACAVSRELHAKGKLTYILDGDNVRHGLNKNLGFSAEDRAENIRRIGEVAKLFVDAGVICIASFISPYKGDRAFCRSLLNPGEFIEVYMKFPLEICESRDSKGLYKLARAGKIKGFTGIDDPYEEPEECEIVMQPINGICPTPNEMAEQVVEYLERNGYLKA